MGSFRLLRLEPRWRLLWMVVLSTALPLFAAEPLSPTVRVMRLDGSQQSADSFAMSSERREFKLGTQVISGDDVRRVTFVGRRAAATTQRGPAERLVEVRLRDGSTLIANNVVVAQDVCRFTVAGLSEQQMELDQLAALRFAPMTTELPKWQLELAQADRQQDRLFLATAETVSAIDGFLEELRSGTVRLEWMKESRQMPLDRLRAVIFATTGARELKPERFAVHLGGGSRLSALSIATDQAAGPTDAATVSIQTRVGVVIKVPQQGIEWIECRSPRVLSLSERQPESATVQSILALPRRWRADRSASGLELQVGAERFERGLGTPAGTRLTYRVPNGAESLVAIVALESQTDVVSDCTCLVRLDGREVVRERLHGDARSKLLRVDCRHAQIVELAVEPGANFDIGANVNWCDASFVLAPH